MKGGRKRLERWADNSKTIEEDKYEDLLESLKKYNTIMEYMNRSQTAKIEENRNLKSAMEVFEQKYSKTKGEKMLDIMRNISGFKTDKKV